MSTRPLTRYLRGYVTRSHTKPSARINRWKKWRYSVRSIAKSDKQRLYFGMQATYGIGSRFASIQHRPKDGRVYGPLYGPCKPSAPSSKRDLSTSGSTISAFGVNSTMAPDRYVIAYKLDSRAVASGSRMPSRILSISGIVLYGT